MPLKISASVVKKALIAIVMIAVIEAAYLLHYQKSLTPKYISSIPINKLKKVYVSRGLIISSLEPAKWEDLVQELGKMQRGGVSSIEYKEGYTFKTLVCVEVNWGDGGRYWVRLQARGKLKDTTIIANIEEPWGGGIFHNNIYYDGSALFRWISANMPWIMSSVSKNKKNKFKRRIDGAGCSISQSVKDKEVIHFLMTEPTR